MHVDRSSWSWTIVVLLLVSLQENIMVVTQSEQVEEGELFVRCVVYIHL